MDPDQILRIVDSLHRDKNIDTEIVFRAIESAFASAARRQYGETSEVLVVVDRDNGSLSATLDGEPLDPAEMIGRIGAQMAKQVIIQKIREAERDSLVEEFLELEDQIVNGSVQRVENSLITVQLNNVEAILPRSEQIPGESLHSGERIRAMVCEVRPQGTRVKVVLSRTRPRFVQRLFEQEIPEIVEGVISINALSREPGYRSKVAVSSADSRVDCVGACVGVRGNRIRSIVDEINSERIDIVRWDDDPEVLIPNALQPAEVDQVLLCDMIGRAIVLVREDQLSLAIGRRGQNVRLASKLCGWDIEIMTAEELDEQIDRAVAGYSALDGVSEDLAAALVEQGYLSYDDLSVIEPDALAEMGDLSMEQVDHIVEQAETRAEEAEVAALEERERQKARAAAEAEAQAQQEAAAAELAATESQSEASSADDPQQDQESESTDSEESVSEQAAAEEQVPAEVSEEQDDNSTFDPYDTLLNIPPDEHPISKYRLLEIAEFEQDKEIIESAVLSRMEHLREMQAGEHEKLVARLMNEVASARVTLLDQEKKSDYDAELRKGRTPNEAEVAPAAASNESEEEPDQSEDSGSNEE